MNDFDDLMQSLGVDLGSSSSSEVQPEDTPIVIDNAFSENDLSEIFADNGYQETPAEIADAEEIIEQPTYEGYHSLGDDMAQEIDNFMGQSREITSIPASESLPNDEETNIENKKIEVKKETLLPINSPTLLMDETTSRFSGIEWYNKIREQRIILAGLGGIGSWTALQLARMSPAALYMYDDDTVEAANMSGQLYSSDDIGYNKADAIYRTIRKYTSATNVNAIPEKFTEATEVGDVMICGFDSMRAREIFFKAWRYHLEKLEPEYRSQCVFIDGRLSVDTLQVFCIKGDDDFNIDRYQGEFLFSDSQADATVCSMKQTTYLACMIGSMIVNLFTNFVAGLLDPIIPYDLPFFTEYDAQNMIFKTEK